MFFNLALAEDLGMRDTIQSSVTNFLPLFLIISVFYFLLIRPQQKKVQQHKEMLSAIVKGDKIMTSGGITGKIHALNEASQFVSIEVAKDTIIEITKEAIIKKLN